MDLKEEILDKKELRNIDDNLFNDFLNEEINNNKRLYKKIEEKKFNPRSKEFKEFKKIVRKRLREIHGVFIKRPQSKEKKQRFLEEMKNSGEKKRIEIIKNLLKTHLSTQERLPHYTALFKRIQEIQPESKNVLDLGCGYNPFAFFLFKRAPTITAIDINKEDQKFIEDFFKQMNTKGLSLIGDLTNDETINLISELSKKSDITFMLKLLDSLEAKKRGTTKKLLEKIESKLIIISFSTQSISGKTEIKAKRKWLEEALKQKEISYSTKEFILGRERFILLIRENFHPDNSKKEKHI